MNAILPAIPRSSQQSCFLHIWSKDLMVIELIKTFSGYQLHQVVEWWVGQHFESHCLFPSGNCPSCFTTSEIPFSLVYSTCLGRLILLDFIILFGEEHKSWSSLCSFYCPPIFSSSSAPSSQTPSVCVHAIWVISFYTQKKYIITVFLYSKTHVTCLSKRSTNLAF